MLSDLLIAKESNNSLRDRKTCERKATIENANKICGTYFFDIPSKLTKQMRRE